MKLKINNRFLICILLLLSIITIILNITTLIHVKNTSEKHNQLLAQVTVERLQGLTTQKFTPVNTPTSKPTNTKNTNTIILKNVKLTGYCPCSICCGPSASGITSTGTKATAGRTIAVDPSVIPYGSSVTINGHTYIAEDCGGAIKGNKIDIFFDSHQEALNFGVRYADVVIGG